MIHGWPPLLRFEPRHSVWSIRYHVLGGGQPLHPISLRVVCCVSLTRTQFTTLGAAPSHFNYPRDTLAIRPHDVTRAWSLRPHRGRTAPRSDRGGDQRRCARTRGPARFTTGPYRCCRESCCTSDSSAYPRTQGRTKPCMGWKPNWTRRSNRCGALSVI